MKKSKAVKKQTTLAKIEPKTRLPELTTDIIINYLCPTATKEEAYMFLMLCKSAKLNPFLREAYLIKFGGKATMVVGKEAFTKRASGNPMFNGFNAGVIVQLKKEIVTAPIEYEKRPGAFVDGPSGERLVGGWAKVYRKDWQHPIEHEVSMAEYNKGQSNWLTIPATMIRKVALVQALREAFPDELAGLYSAEEIGYDQFLPEKPITKLAKEIKPAADQKTITRFWEEVAKLQVEHEAILKHCADKHKDWKIQHPEDLNLLTDEQLRTLYVELKPLSPIKDEPKKEEVKQ